MHSVVPCPLLMLLQCFAGAQSRAGLDSDEGNFQAARLMIRFPGQLISLMRPCTKRLDRGVRQAYLTPWINGDRLQRPAGRQLQGQLQAHAFFHLHGGHCFPCCLAGAHLQPFPT